MTPEEIKSGIFDVIRSVVCARCGKRNEPICRQHRQRCEAEYDREAHAIYEYLKSKGLLNEPI